ncbi:DUF397 domain-containing protein [Streptomyces sp. BH097]|uniref:DUF397 domain-containing protein n=1 Tax=unclassified Streptomyces TaxID=2593676 RepID=UPI003BB67B0C
MTAHRRFDPAMAAWFKASHSSGDQNCLESARVPGIVPVRDSKQQKGPFLLFQPRPWTSFVADLKNQGSA